jgi:hypothetical protein
MGQRLLVQGTHCHRCLLMGPPRPHPVITLVTVHLRTWPSLPRHSALSAEQGQLVLSHASEPTSTYRRHLLSGWTCVLGRATMLTPCPQQGWPALQ